MADDIVLAPDGGRSRGGPPATAGRNRNHGRAPVVRLLVFSPLEREWWGTTTERSKAIDSTTESSN
jgi:hypothetical protein